MTNPAYDYGEFEGEAIGGNLMTRIEGLAQDHLDAEARVASLEEQLTEAKAIRRDIAEKQLPDLLDEAGLGDSTINTPAGHIVKMSETIRGSIPKGNEQPAFEWLEDHDNGALIKRTFTIEFGKGDDKWADKFERDCRQRKKSLNIKRKMAVNPMSLQSFVRQQLDAGVAIPMDVFGVFRQRFAKVKLKVEK